MKTLSAISRLRTYFDECRGLTITLALAACLMAACQPHAHAAEPVQMVPPPLVDESQATGDGLETAVFAGGCFWGVQGVFQHVKGVRQAVSGYAGGKPSTAQYETVSTGSTGHAESVKVSYDPKQVTYGQLLQIYFSVVADPTELNRQGPDSGTQYRSALFIQDPEQQKIAQTYIAQLDKAGIFGQPIVTKTEPFTGFYRAEDYHQDFLELNPTYPYIAYNDIPKVKNLQRLFPDRYSARAALVN